MKSFYITTTLPYVNANLHMGHAMEFVRADAIARWKKLSGYEVFFNTGTDEHGQKIFETAKKAGKDVQAYVDASVENVKSLLSLLDVTKEVHFTRTTDAHHEKAAQEFWKRVRDNGFIYKKNYKAKYCVVCEEFKTESEIANGRCALHPDRELEVIEEENYFFRFSAFGEKLLKLYDKKGHSIVPDFRMNEMREFIKKGLEDFSISRLKTKMPWGVPVPDDPDQVMYVWFDALVNYISALGWPEDEKKFDEFWIKGTPTQYCGKDNTRFQSVMWQAMLMAAGLPPTHTVVVNGFITGEGGIKMSKSLGNAVDPLEILDEYGSDAFRYFMCREISSFEDSPFTPERFKGAYNGSLANGFGNLVSRVMKMANTHLESPVQIKDENVFSEKYADAMNAFNLQEAMNIIWRDVAEMDEMIQEKAPFKLVKTDKPKAVEIIKDLCMKLHRIAVMLEPVMPKTSFAVRELIKTNSTPPAPLFLRRE